MIAVLGLKGNDMSTSLDKLRALTSKLDDKLAEKNKMTSLYREREEEESIPGSVKEAMDLINTTQENIKANIVKLNFEL